MRTLKLALAATAAFAFNANAQTPVTGMGSPPSGAYQQIAPVVGAGFMDMNGIAFHAGGVAACDGCHVMHNANGGVAKSTNGRAGEPAWSSHSNAYLLQGSDQSSTCLICHGSPTPKSSQAVSTDNQFVVADLSGGATPSYRSPGGDFGWLTVSFAAATNGALSDGRSHGHNVQAKDFGWATDARFAQGVAPGGTFTLTGGSDLASFACSSCHDPHGRYRMQLGGSLNGGVQFAGPFSTSPATIPIAASGSYGDMPQANYAVGAYRLLAGKSYTPASKPGFPFPNDPPIAVAPRNYNKSEATSETRVQYGTGMSEWCKNCHSEIHSEGYVSGFGGQRHPAASNAYLKPTQYNIYNTYVSSGVYQAGASLYTSLVPFEQGTTPTLTALQTAANAGAAPTAGATSSVMCLSCHRAHASAFDSMVRWDQNATFTTDSGSNFTGGLTARTSAQTQAGYYDRTVSASGNGSTIIGPFQRSFCNKCHGKD
jgi:predicted CXXCH cytochrome family protein